MEKQKVDKAIGIPFRCVFGFLHFISFAQPSIPSPDQHRHL